MKKMLFIPTIILITSLCGDLAAQSSSWRNIRGVAGIGASIERGVYGQEYFFVSFQSPITHHFESGISYGLDTRGKITTHLVGTNIDFIILKRRLFQWNVRTELSYLHQTGLLGESDPSYFKQTLGFSMQFLLSERNRIVLDLNPLGWTYGRYEHSPLKEQNKLIKNGDLRVGYSFQLFGK